MAVYPIFLSVVFVVRNQSDHIEEILLDAGARVSSLVSDYELIIVDNASEDNTVTVLKNIQLAKMDNPICRSMR